MFNLKPFKKMSKDDTLNSICGMCSGMCLACLSIALFVYTMVVYAQQVVPNYSIENTHDSNYNNQLNWLHSFALAEIALTSISFGLVILLTICACLVVCCCHADDKSDYSGLLVVYIIICFLVFTSAFVLQTYYISWAVPISSVVYNDCNTNTTYSNEQPCQLFYSSFNPIVTLLEVVYSFYCVYMFVFVCSGFVVCIGSCCIDR